MKFAMKGSKSVIFYGSHSSRPLEIRGHFYCSGPQPVSDAGGVPTWVAELFNATPELKTIALSTTSGGSVWSRPDEVTK